MRLFSLYLAQGRGWGLVFLSPDPLFDFTFLRSQGEVTRLEPLTPFLPVGIAGRLFHGIMRRYRPADLSSAAPVPLQELRDLCRREAGRMDFSLRDFGKGSRPAALEGPSPAVHSLPPRDEPGEVASLLAGRLLSLREIARLAGYPGEGGTAALQRLLQVLCLRGAAALVPALYPLKGSLVRCQRCGWEGLPDAGFCRVCGSEACCTCPDCRLMGALSLCEPLYTAVPQQFAERQVFEKTGVWGRLQKLFGLGKRDGEREEVGWREVLCTPLIFGAVPWGKSDRRRGVAEEEAPSGAVRPRHPLRLEVRLTPPQEAAAAALRDFGARAAPGSTFLVWAACGAGKTEVSFPLLGDALSRGEQVLFATPRRDVVLEIAPRLTRVFGKKMIVPLYGGSGNLGREAPLIVATTHQALRFYRKFDLVILDEGDAFPYPGSRMLQFAVERARRPGGRLVLLTATPAPWMFGTRKGRVEIIKIPARPHGFPLPEPRFLTVDPLQNAGEKRRLRREVLDLIASLLRLPGARLFVFVPSVALTRVVGEALRAAAGEPPLEGIGPEAFQWSHAGDPHRDRKRESFMAGDFPVLVTTTIMERGVTVPRVHVLVLDAGQEMVFDTPTLVQIAGRCGRSPDYPTGEVWFVSRQISRAMEEARAQIRSFNEEARRKGYLRDDYGILLKEFQVFPSGVKGSVRDVP
jgi:competence protein ComFA